MAQSSKIEGMGAMVHAQGVAFRVWAPHAKAVAVVGDFNDWKPEPTPLVHEANGYWYGESAQAKAGDEYKFHLTLDEAGKETVQRVDPYARQVTNSVGNGIIYAPDQFEWHDDDFQMPPWNELVIYEMHVGSFSSKDGNTGNFAGVLARMDHLTQLGVNCVQLMPVAEFAGDLSWGYNPAHIFAVESAYGGPDELKAFVDAMHSNGIAVILDVVYNHFGPSDLDLWQFDGWHENDGGGIYFYNDWRADTPWGHTRPDYGREEVRRYIHDNTMMWLNDYRMDGLRFDATVYIRTVKGPGDESLEEGWKLLQWINKDIAEQHPNKITIAEDLQSDSTITDEVGAGGAGFGAQWSATFVHPIREAVITPDDDARNIALVAESLRFKYNVDAFERVIYSESHDEVANGKARVPHEIFAADAEGWFAQKRSTLAAALVFTTPGIPMIFQGQEFLQGEWFRDDAPLEWEHQEEYRSIVHLYHDLIRLRVNRDQYTRGLCGQNIEIFLQDEESKLLAFHRWDVGGPGDDVVVVANFRSTPFEGIAIHFPAPGAWKLRFNSDSRHYSEIFEGKYSHDVNAEQQADSSITATLNIGPYSVLIYSQDRE
ncbi:MAG: alpha-amylase family glycosyl hydrolase [Litorilinea sp.]